MTQPEDAGLRAVLNRDFSLYLGAVTLSLTGFWVRIIAQSWLVYRLTSSPWDLGLVGFVTTLPLLAVGPFAGVVVDRVDRRLMLALTQGSLLVLVVVLGVLDWFQLVQVWHVMAIGFVSGVIAAFDWPTRLSIVPNLVAPNQVARAAALNSAAWNGSRIGGPVLAGVIVSALGTAPAFALSAALVLPVLAISPLVRLRSRRQRGRGEGVLANLAAGYRYVARHEVLGLLLLIEVVPTVFGQTYPILMPVFAADVLGEGGLVLGTLMASLGAGELVGTLVIALTAWLPRRPLTVLVALVGFAATMLLFALSRSLPLSMAALALSGFAMASYATLNGTLVQSVVDDAYRGRVMSVYTLVWGLTPIGNLELGKVADLFGAPLAVSVNAALVFAFALVLIVCVPRLRQRPSSAAGRGGHR